VLTSSPASHALKQTPCQKHLAVIRVVWAVMSAHNLIRAVGAYLRTQKSHTIVIRSVLRFCSSHAHRTGPKRRVSTASRAGAVWPQTNRDL